MFVLDGAAVNAYSKVSDQLVGRQPLPTEHGCEYIAFGVSHTADRIMYPRDCHHVEVVPVTVTLAEPSHWTTLAPMPTERRGLSVVAAAGRIYAIGGSTIAYDFVPTAAVEVYDPSTDSWSTASPMPQALTYSSTAVVGDRIYVIGGWVANLTARPWVFVYDIPTNTWTQRSNAPHAISLGSANVHDGKIYVTNGYAGGYQSHLDRYDPDTDTWTSLAPMPTYHPGPAGSGFVNGKLYVAGGEAHAIVNAYDPSTNSWQVVASMPEVRMHGAGGEYDGKLYTFTGADPTSNYTASVLIYDPATNSWTRSEPGPTHRDLAAGAWLNGVFYVTGGAKSATALTRALEAYRP